LYLLVQEGEVAEAEPGDRRLNIERNIRMNNTNIDQKKELPKGAWIRGITEPV